MIKTDKPISAVKYNGADIPLDAHPADGIVVTSRDANGKPLEIDFYGSIVYGNTFGVTIGANTVPENPMAYVEKINFKNELTEIHTAAFAFGHITELRIPETVILPSVVYQGLNSPFKNCSKLKSVEYLTSSNIYTGFFISCTSLEDFNAPNISSVSTANAQYGAFGGCTALKNVSLGSVGHSITTLHSSTFMGCTQDFLTITAYTTAALKDTILANIRNGATNATIILKDSTTGETLITSTP